MAEYLNGSGALLVSRDETWKAGVCKPVPGMEPLADQLAEAFRQLKNDPERREKMAQSGPERARMFSRQAYYENFGCPAAPAAQGGVKETNHAPADQRYPFLHAALLKSMWRSAPCGRAAG